ncbi:uncharacterized protein BJ212DRAFT_1295369 [Suillus subaureus]|uniref:Uncharacterized protein n=1 Tax=Suillus subaureus TaxID=48587 RepID=A0A9P7JJP7_9AGAM|nr:uncharacterized protein BJ212DRAFT_1295369 [Suillus subaureus]KAG1826106.1 hypothetical protein BJ212DRAFT_1295369 [Suillus subaureus]
MSIVASTYDWGVIIGLSTVKCPGIEGFITLSLTQLTHIFQFRYTIIMNSTAQRTSSIATHVHSGVRYNMLPTKIPHQLQLPSTAITELLPDPSLSIIAFLKFPLPVIGVKTVHGIMSTEDGSLTACGKVEAMEFEGGEEVGLAVEEELGHGKKR